ncbi:MAG: beta-galactosidase, partial [Muribaculaceae bacterium]|nr:beta-galactosidase [Muribaculaceae bacterium]
NIEAGPIHQGVFYRFTRDISELVKPGEKNRLEVTVNKHSANKSINAAERKADWWLFGGIYRPVWLEITPREGMRHVVHDARHDGSLTSRIELDGQPRGSIAVTLVDASTGGTVYTTTTPLGGDSIVTISGNVKGVKPWSTEKPNLYTVIVELRDADGNATQRKTTRIGFRTVEFFPQDGLYLNSHKIILKGVNRHSFSVDGGRATSAEQSRQDALLIKEMNMNAVRSHYPPDEHFLDACDSLGILYMDELAGWQNGYDTEVGTILVREMIERDVNHPCIIIWSNGNEGGWNEALDAEFARHDMLQRRHLVHPWADFNDLDTHHYPAYLTGVARFTNGYRVFMPTEFMHSMYDQGGGAGLRNFWDRWKTNPMFAGGFIWAFCDEAPARTDRGGVLDSDGSNAPDGIVGPRREREGSFYAIREQWCPLQIAPFLVTPRFDGRFAVTNESDFTSLDRYKMTYQLVVNPAPAEGTDITPRVIAEGAVTLPETMPGETRFASFTPPTEIAEADLLRLAAFAPDGRQVGEWNIPTRLVGDYFNTHVAPSAIAASPRKAKTSITVKDTLVTLSSPRVQVTFDSRTGLLQRIVADRRDVPFTDGPMPVGMKMKFEPELSSAQKDGDDVVFCARYKGAVDSIVWRLTPAGLLSMDALLLNRAGGGGGFDDAFMDTEVYNLGLSFSYPDSLCTGMTWLGRGPYRVWKNRTQGARIDTWHKDYNNTITGESFENLIYPEFKGYHGNVYWATLESDTAPMTFYSRRDGIFYHIFTPEEPHGAQEPTMPAFPTEGNFSFLLDIPAIRSFKPIEQQGPDSQPGNIRIKKGDEGLHIDITFDFLN